MKKLGWYLVSAAVAAFILGGVFLLAANLYVQSRTVQHRIREALSVSLRMPVSIRKTTYTPWDGLRIDGLTARPEANPSALGGTGPISPDSLTAGSFRVYFALTPLLSRKFVVKDVLLDRPQLSWAQEADDRWRLPTAQGEGGRPHVAAGPPASTPPVNKEAAPARTPPVAAAKPGAAPSSAGQSNTTPSPLPAPPRSPGMRVSVDGFRLRHGSMDFLNHRRGLLGRFDEVDVDGRLEGSDRASGFATVARAALPRAGIKLTNFQSHFSYSPDDGLALNDILATLAGGGISASCHLRTGETGSPFTARCRLDDIGLGQLIREAGGKHGFVEGKLQGTLSVSGVSDDAAQCSAAGHIQLNDTRIHDFPLFQAVGEALRIDDLRDLRFKTARFDYQLAGTVLRIQPLVLASNDVQITAEGRYHLRDDRLDLHARLTIDEAVSRQLPRFIGQQFTACGDEAPGASFIDFKVNGPLNKLSSNLYQRLVPNSLDGLLDSFLRPRPKRARDKTPPPDGESTPPTDSAPGSDDP